MYDDVESPGVAGIGSQALKQAASISANRPTKRQELEQAKKQLLAHVERINEALAALDKNPGAEEVMNAIDRCRY